MNESLRNEKLAIHGGEPVRRERMPPRLALGDEEVRMINRSRNSIPTPSSQ